MKSFVTTTFAAVAAIAAAGVMAIASTDADARPYHRGGGGRVGVYIGAGILAAPFLYRPYYYGPYAYGYPYYGYGPAYYPQVVEQPTTYVEQQPMVGAPSAPPPSSAPQAQAPQQYWYFCQDTQTYYPHVQNCATPWQRVVPHAPQ